MHTRSPLPAVLILTSMSTAQTTWIVDASGLGQFTTIEAAHDAAAPGDTLLVRPGNYPGFTRNPAKGVRILGDGPGVLVTDRVSLSSVPAGQTLLLAGFGINVINPGTYGGLTGLFVQNCDNLVLTALAVRGSDSNYLNVPGGAGIWLDNCRGVACGVVAHGGSGWNGISAYPTPGGSGIGVYGGHAALSGCSLRSGDSGIGLFGTPAAQPALWCASQSVVVVDGCSLQSGVPALFSLVSYSSRVLLGNHLGLVPNEVYAHTPPASIDYEGAVTAFVNSLPLTPRPQPGLVGPDTVPRGGNIQWTVHGAPGSVGASVASLDTAPLYLPPLFDSTLFAAGTPSSVLFGLVTIGPGGSTNLSLAVPNVPALVNTFVFLQVAGWLTQPTWKASGVAVTRIL